MRLIVVTLLALLPTVARGTETVDFGAATPEPPAAVEYRPGRGLHIAPADLTLGGYGNIEARRLEGGPFNLEVSELSALVSWSPLARVHAFGELEVEDLVRVRTAGSSGTGDVDLRLERLYAEYEVSDHATLRVGKFLTPIGRWNVIHAAPLVWTASRPVVTELPFDQHNTGAMLTGRVFARDLAVTYTAFGQFVDQLEPVPQAHEAHRQAGARLELGDGSWGVGASFLATLEHGDWQHLGGIDAQWDRPGTEVLFEAIFDRANQRGDSEWGGFLQAAQLVVEPLWAVARYEHFNRGGEDASVNLVDLGLAVRPVPYATIKLGYTIADRHVRFAPAGARLSCAVLF